MSQALTDITSPSAAMPQNAHQTSSREDIYVLAESGPLTVRLAQSKKDIKAAQALRYRVFYKTMGAHPKFRQRLSRVDSDRYDGLCDHLLLTTTDKVKKAPKKARLANGETIIGCYRLLRRDVAERESGFYTQDEFDLTPFLNSVGRDLNLLELGRSCVHPDYRSGKGISLMWKGLGAYVAQHGIDAMMGCASFSGTDPHALAQPLSYLHHHHAGTDGWQVRAHDDQFVDMNMLAADAIDEKAARRALPPVLRGYIRSGALVGTGAVIDHRFNTVDVFVLMPMQQLSDRYRRRYAVDEQASQN